MWGGCECLKEFLGVHLLIDFSAEYYCYENQMDLSQQTMAFAHSLMFVMQLMQSCWCMRGQRQKGDTYVHHMRLHHRIWCKSWRAFILITTTPKGIISYMKSRINGVMVPNLIYQTQLWKQYHGQKGPLINNCTPPTAGIKFPIFLFSESFVYVYAVSMMQIQWWSWVQRNWRT